MTRVLAGPSMDVHNSLMFIENERASILNATERAIRASLGETFGRDIEVVLKAESETDFDAVLVIVLDGPPARFEVDVKSQATATGVDTIHRRSNGRPVILFVPRLTRSVMDTCRSLGVNCADTDGNLFVRTASSAIDIAGRPVGASREFASGDARLTRLTSRAGLQIVFLLLADPARCRSPYRDVAQAAGVSVGSVSSVYGALERDGYLVTNRSGRHLANTSRLLDLWVEGYRRRLYDRVWLGDFAAEEKAWWRGGSDVIRSAGGQWGGETAVWALAGDLRPARGIVYVDKVEPSLIGALRMRKEPPGSGAAAQFRRRFWRVPEWLRRDVVPSPLVYADLMSDGDPRLIEAASALRRNDPTLRQLDEL